MSSPTIKILSVHRLVALMELNDVMVNKTLVHSFSVSILMFPDLLKKDVKFTMFLICHNTDLTLSKTLWIYKYALSLWRVNKQHYETRKGRSVHIVKVQTEASAERFSGQCMYTDLLHFNTVSIQTCYKRTRSLIMLVTSHVRVRPHYAFLIMCCNIDRHMAGRPFCSCKSFVCWWILIFFL